MEKQIYNSKRNYRNILKNKIRVEKNFLKDKKGNI